eukprot:2743153-Amphidinium_carterae.1
MQALGVATLFGARLNFLAGTVPEEGVMTHPCQIAARQRCHEGCPHGPFAIALKSLSFKLAFNTLQPDIGWGVDVRR